ncbi:hypothetical protein AVEN_180203-1 [Araneus ventricosus]|uniref:Uncharacterized protein n=1 Tax=Araneus ventricosus TaxID=182803 RepID=A0A4Y2QDB4_ARAVE|nr:hypothetical protein AVEN_271874-1 [Araneus ventricosus]GBN61364.1 hypothetical protein AVEN_180203-1 [Araneus ventricosus]
MPCKFLTAQEALEFLWTLYNSDLDGIDNELVIVPPDPDALRDTKDIDDSSRRKIEETMRGDQYLPMISMCITSYNKYKNEVDLFDNHAADYFTSIQGKNGTGLYLLMLLKQPLLLHGISINYLVIIV